jgi:hypothetical protein
MYRCRTMTTYYMYDTIRRINSDVEHMYGSNRFKCAVDASLTTEFEMRVLSRNYAYHTASGLEIPYHAPSTKYHLIDLNHISII